MRAEDKEKEGGGQEQEIEVVPDSETEQQIGDKEETEAILDTEREIVEEDAQGDQPDKSTQKEDISMQELLRIIMESNKQINKENLRKQNETLSKKFDKIDENSRKQNETLSEKFDKIDEKFKKQEENSCLLYTSRCV